MKNKSQIIALIVSMTVFGTVGIFSKQIPLPSGVIALSRSVIGVLFLAAVMLIMGRRPDMSAIRKNLVKLILSGICLGANWILFFEACKQTTVASATLSYYLAPTILVIASVFIFSEKITLKRAVGMLATLAGMILVSGVIGGAEGVRGVGVLLGIAAAFLYATVVIFNKLLCDMNAFDKTAVQFLVSALVLIPYVLIFERVEGAVQNLVGLKVKVAGGDALLENRVSGLVKNFNVVIVNKQNIVSLGKLQITSVNSHVRFNDAYTAV